MTSPIAPISVALPIAPVAPVAGTSALSGAGGVNTDFAGKLAESLEQVQSLQNRSNELAVQVADGTLADPATYTIAATEASLAIQLTTAVRNKAVEAFQEIMRLQA
jgi:flagellar hook-basal body complex protein FliE